MDLVPAHRLSSFVLIGGSLVVPLLALCTYWGSGEPLRKAVQIAFGIAVWGLGVLLFAGFLQFQIANPTVVWGFVLANFAAPSIIVLIFRDYFVGNGLSLAWLTLPQAFRYMGVLFILENVLGHTGTVFAYTAGFGDFAAAIIATMILLQMWAGERPGKFAFYALVIFGTADFLVAYTLSFMSTQGTVLNLLARDETHLMSLLPLALLPYFLVPFAMAYHTVMFLTLRRHGAPSTGEV
ncbi:MAG: hypothetical protein AAGH43_02075 [Pseudomonadota bacterium]